MAAQNDSFLASWLGSLQLNDAQAASDAFLEAGLTSAAVIPPELELNDLKELGVVILKDRIKIRSAILTLKSTSTIISYSDPILPVPSAHSASPKPAGLQVLSYVLCYCI